MKTFTANSDIELKFKYNSKCYTIPKGKRLPVRGCGCSLSIDEGKPSAELFLKGFGCTKIKLSKLTLEEIPDLPANYTKAQWLDYAKEYSSDVAQEFLGCADIVKASEAYRMFHPTKNAEIWENQENLNWFKQTFKRNLFDFMCGVSYGIANVYSLDIIKFEKYLAFDLGYPKDQEGSMKDFMIKIFGQEATEKFQKLFLSKA